MDDQPRSLDTFQFLYSLDRKNFFRRACPKCGLEFKTKAEPGEITSTLQPAFRQMGLEIGETNKSDDDRDNKKSYFICPYCGEQSETGDFMTSDFKKYIERFVYREVMLPQINSMFENFADSLDHQKSGGGFLSIDLSMEFNRSLNPPRPISGPEPPDMKIVNLFCCNKEIKILENWNCGIYCPYCSSIEVLR